MVKKEKGREGGEEKGSWKEEEEVERGRGGGARKRRWSQEGVEEEGVTHLKLLALAGGSLSQVSCRASFLLSWSWILRHTDTSRVKTVTGGNGGGSGGHKMINISIVLLCKKKQATHLDD